MHKLLFLFMAMFAAQAMARLFPPNAKYGEVSAVSQAQIAIGNQTLRPAPGLRVFNKDNMIVFLRQLPVGALVGYQLDSRGELFQIWILSQEEATQKKLTTSTISISSD